MFQEHRSCLSKILCCGGSSRDTINVNAQLTKPLYFPDETIELNIDIDNSNNSRTLDDIQVTLRQIIDVKTNKKNAYKHGTSKYDTETTTLYDLSIMNLGMLDQGENDENKFTAAFNIADVVHKLHEVRDKLQTAKAADEETGDIINKGLRQKTGLNRQNSMVSSKQI